MGSERGLIELTGSGRGIVAMLPAERGDATDACNRGAVGTTAP